MDSSTEKESRLGNHLTVLKRLRERAIDLNRRIVNVKERLYSSVPSAPAQEIAQPSGLLEHIEMTAAELSDTLNEIENHFEPIEAAI